MKMLIAYIKRHKLADVTLALHQIDGLSGASVCDIRGFGRGRAKDAQDRITEDLVDYVPGVRLEISCSDDLADQVLSTIEANARTGLRGDGKVFVLNVEEAVRISTGERGKTVV